MPKLYKTNLASKANVKVFVTDVRSEADLIEARFDDRRDLETPLDDVCPGAARRNLSCCSPKRIMSSIRVPYVGSNPVNHCCGTVNVIVFSVITVFPSCL